MPLDMNKRKLGAAVGMPVLATYCAVSTRMFGDFQSERLAVQVGETLGRSLAIGSSTKAIAKKVLDFIEESRLGKASFKKLDIRGATEGIGVFTIAESAEAYCVSGATKPSCYMLRGLIRGALVGIYHQENIVVKETKCAAAGEKECEFEAYWTPV